MGPDRRPLPAWAVDTLLGAAVALVVSVVISAGLGGEQRPDVLAYGWAVGLGALMLARRRYPRVVLAVSVLGLLAYYAAGYPAVGVAVPLAAALFSAAERGRLRAAVTAAVSVLVVSLVFRLVEGQDAAFVLGYDLVPHVTLMAAAIAWGDSLRTRREQQVQQRRLAELSAREHAQEAERRVQAERLAVARDLHDSLGHTISVISLHSEVAREAIGRDDVAASAAVALIKDASSQTMRELRSTVALLRAPGDTAGPVLSLDGIDPVLDTARAAGLQVSATVQVAAGALPRSVDVAAYRIVQEAVTNVVRHAGATRVDVEARTVGATLHLEITDDGTATDDVTAQPPASTHGHGITGMRERAHALGGELHAGRRPGPGFTVHATLPLEAQP